MPDGKVIKALISSIDVMLVNDAAIARTIFVGKAGKLHFLERLQLLYLGLLCLIGSLTYFLHSSCCLPCRVLARYAGLRMSAHTDISA
jgi:hypothetical protein